MGVEPSTFQVVSLKQIETLATSVYFHGKYFLKNDEKMDKTFQLTELCRFIQLVT